jgi:hypothetical protein
LAVLERWAFVANAAHQRVAIDLIVLVGVKYADFLEVNVCDVDKQISTQ